MALSAGTVFVTVVPDTSKFLASLTAGLAPLKSQFSKAFGSIEAAANTALIGIGAGLVAAGVAGVKMATEFDASFTRISALSNASSDDIARWKDQVLSLAGETARSPKELADALFFLASAGLKANQIMPALEVSAKAAAVGLGSTADVANIVASALNAYAGQGLEAADVTDTLVAAVREGRAEPEEFAKALGRILPVASAAGVEFDSVTASLASLSNVGLDVNEGVTAMRGFLLALEAPGTQAADALQSVGLSADQVRGVLEEGGLLAAMQLLEDRTGGDLDVMRQIVPNVRALAGVLGITQQEAVKVDAIFRRVADATGGLDVAFSKTSETTEFRFQRLVATLQAALIRFGESILPIVNAVVDALTRMIDVLGPALPLILKLYGAFLLFKAVVALPALLTAIATGIEAIAGAAAAGAGLRTFAATLATMTGPIGLVVAALAILSFQLFTIGSRAERAKADIDKLTEGGELSEIFIDIAHGTETWAQKTETAQVAVGLLAAKMHEAGVEGDALATAYNAVDAALQAGDITLQQAERFYRAFGDSAEEARARSNSFALETRKHFDEAGHAVRNFAGLTGSALADYQDSLHETLTVSDDVMGKLAAKAKLTADQILAAFTKQIRAQVNYQTNFEKLVARGLPDKFAQQIAEMGLDGARFVEALANANDQKFDQIVGKWQRSQQVAKDTEDAILGIGDAVKKLPNGKTIKLNLTGYDPAKTQLQNLKSMLDDVSGTYTTTVIVKTLRSSQEVTAHAAGGIVTRPEIALIGEAGPEAVIPLDEWDRHRTGGTQRIVGNLRMTDWRQGIATLDGEMAWEDLARSS